MKRLQFGSIILLLGILMFSAGCKEDNEEFIPYEYVNFSINPASIEYGNLEVPGSWAYVTGGYRGILIYHLSQYEYVAFDRACTFDWEKDCAQTEVDEDNIFLVCSCCDSKFLITDGSPFEGPAPRSLRQYSTYFDGTYLYVSNQ